jgi:glycosyltransferase involved in cell wall biosynthesis
VRVAYVVQRYGDTVAGGAEQHCRAMAERLARRGHEVHVATTCAQSYTDWANVHEPGVSTIDDVTVRRFPVAQTRDKEQFDALTEELLARFPLRPMEVQRAWLREQGPYTPELARWLRDEQQEFDCVVCFTFLYWTTWSALRTCAGRTPVVLHPTVHDEPALHFSIYDQLFRAPDVFAYSTPEEVDLIARRFHLAPRGEVIGIGVDPGHGDEAVFRHAYPEVGDAPYILYVGRVDEGKGAGELYRDFVAYKAQSPGELKLVFLGERIAAFARHADVIETGFVDASVRDGALAGALALVQPSPFESFSMILTEAFAQGRPALVQSRSNVLVGHAVRSGAAIPYDGRAEFAAALDELATVAGRADAMGARGRAYVEAHYSWDVVMDRYEAFLAAHSRSTGARSTGARSTDARWS